MSPCFRFNFYASNIQRRKSSTSCSYVQSAIPLLPFAKLHFMLFTLISKWIYERKLYCNVCKLSDDSNLLRIISIFWSHSNILIESKFTFHSAEFRHHHRCSEQVAHQYLHRLDLHHLRHHRSNELPLRWEKKISIKVEHGSVELEKITWF